MGYYSPIYKFAQLSTVPHLKTRPSESFSALNISHSDELL